MSFFAGSEARDFEVTTCDFEPSELLENARVSHEEFRGER